MAESYRYRSALSPMALRAVAVAADAADEGVWLGERPGMAQFNLRGDVSDAAFAQPPRRALGATLPLEPNTVSRGPRGTALWLGPDEWLLVTDESSRTRMHKALAALESGVHASVTDLSAARTIIRLGGLRARDVIMKGCGLDLHPRVFGVGQCAQSTLALCQIIIHRVEEGEAGPVYDLYVARSFAIYLWRWLVDAAAEYGSATVLTD